MTAAEVARETAEDADVDWRALEVAAFAGHRELQDVIDPRQEHHTSSRWRKALLYTALAIAGVVLFAVILAPAFALATVIWGWFGPQRPGPEVTAPVAAALFLLSGAVLVVESVLWVRSGRQKEHTYAWHAGVTAALGIVTIVVALGMMALDGSLRLWPWCLVIAAPTILAVAFLRSQATRSVPEAGERTQEEIAAALARRIPTARQDRIRGDLEAALRDLEGRGVLDAATAGRARDAPLGTLAFRLDPLPEPAEEPPEGPSAE